MRLEKLDDLVVRLHAHPRRRLTLLVGVDGPPASGKSTFARALAELDPGLELISVDEFRLSAGEAPPPARSDRPGDVSPGFDWRRLRGQVLLPLGRDAPARYQPSDTASGGLGPWREVGVGGIVVVDGVHACMRQLATFYDFRVWVDAPWEVRRLRLAARRDLDGSRLPQQSPGEAGRSAHLRIDGSVELDPAAQYARVLGSPDLP